LEPREIQPQPETALIRACSISMKTPLSQTPPNEKKIRFPIGIL
jgi:hypothetical protein